MLSQKIKSQDALIQVTQDLEGYICYAAKANAFVLRADGRIGKCTVALNDPRNDVGKLNLDGTIVWNDGRLDPWLRGLHSGDSETLACPLAEMQPLQNDSCFIPLDTILV